MPEASTEFGKITQHVQSMAHGMEATHSAAQQAGDALGNVLKTLIVVDITLKTIEKASAFSPMARYLKEAFSTLGRTAEQLKAIHTAENVAARAQLRDGEITRKEYDSIIEKTRLRLPLLNAQLKLEAEMNKFGAIRLGILTSTVALTGRVFYLNQEFNEALIKSNSSLRSRFDLLTTNLRVQRETGISFRTVTDAQRELVNLGFQSRSNYQSVLTIVSKLHEGLGMSVQEAAQLAVVTERQVKTSFKATADVVAGLVDSTSLAADEVGRLATNLARAMAVIKPGGVQEFPQIVKLVGKYEDALKKFGGQVGQFEQLIARMTKPEGLLSAGVLGISSPEQLLKTAGVDKAIDNFYKYATSQLSGARGFDRMFRLDILAEQFGTTAEQINAMIQAIDDAKKARTGEITLSERFRQQMESTGAGLKRIVNSLTALAHGALYPLIVIVNHLTSAVAGFLEKLIKHRPLAIGAMIAIDLGIIATIIQLRSAAKAFWEVVVAAKIAALSLKEYAAQQGLSSVAGGAGKVVEGAAGGAGLFGRIVAGLRTVLSPVQTILKTGFSVIRIALGLLASPIGLIAAALGSAIVIWSYIKKIQAKSIEDRLAANAKLATMQTTYLDTARSQVYAAVRTGDQTKAQAVIDKVIKQIGSRRGSFSDLTEREAAIKQAQFSKDLQKLVPLAQYTATQFGKLNVSPQENADNLKESTDFQQKIADNTKKSIDEAKKMREQENKNADEQRRQSELQYLRNGGVIGRGTSIYNVGPL
jgi:hypothetical protein